MRGLAFHRDDYRYIGIIERNGLEEGTTHIIEYYRPDARTPCGGFEDDDPRYWNISIIDEPQQ